MQSDVARAQGLVVAVNAVNVYLAIHARGVINSPFSHNIYSHAHCRAMHSRAMVYLPVSGSEFCYKI